MRNVVGALGIALIAYLVVGNLAILGLSAAARSSGPQPASAVSVAGVEHFQPVDDHLWRGSAPSSSGYAELARLGFTTVIDLRAEDDIDIDEEAVAELGIDLVRIPVRDGQAPSPAKVARFLRATASSEGDVFVHCGAGVGRAGTMAAAWLVASDGGDAMAALYRNLAVGPPSLEQLAFVRGLAGGGVDRPGPVITAASRVLDAPRRLWSRYGL